MATTYLNKTLSGSPTNNLKWTWSAWVKKTKNGIIQPLFYADNGGSANFTKIQFHDTDSVLAQNYVGSSTYGYKITTPVYRDTNAWYHLVMRYDSANATENQRFIIWVNGVDSGTLAMDSNTFPDQNRASIINAGNEHRIGRGNNNVGSNYFDGIMSHVHFCDGYAYSASDFGSTDSTTGEWKINTAPSVTYGTNGFFILKDGNSVTDQSGQSNNFTVAAGTLTSTKDCPSNVYCVWNRLVRQTGDMDTVGNGNTYLATQNDNTWRSAYGTIGFQGTGKFYAEFKCGNLGGTQHLGIVDVDQQNANNGSKFSDASRAYAYANNGQKVAAGSQSSYGNSWDSGAYLQIAYNNGAIWFGKDGTWQNSATISEINAGTTTNATFTGIDTSKTYTIGWNGYADDMIELNAGNGWFRTTEVGSPNNPSSGDTGAKFKYTVPTGYQPLSTKGLNE